MRRESNLTKLLVLFVAIFVLCIQSAQAQNAEATARPADKSPHKSGFVAANGVRLHYLDWGGTGDVLLLLTGFGDDAHVFDDFAPKFTDHFRVIALTRRGFGESDKPATGYDITTRVEDIRQFLDALKIKRVNLVGHSAAGDEMTTFASLYPQRVNKLVYLDAAYNRARIPEMILSSPGTSAEGRRLFLEVQNSPDAAKVVVEDMPPANTWEINKAMWRAIIAFRPDYTKVKAPALSFYATSERSSFVTPQTDEATRRKADEWWLKNFIPYTRANIKQFRREASRGRVVELRNATHYVFLGRTADEVVRQTREFLLK